MCRYNRAESNNGDVMRLWSSFLRVSASNVGSVASLSASEAPIVERIAVARRDGHDPVAGGERLLGAAKRQQRGHQDGEGLRRAGPDLDRPADQLVGFPGMPLMQSDEAEQMQGIELAGIARQHRAIGR